MMDLGAFSMNEPLIGVAALVQRRIDRLAQEKEWLLSFEKAEFDAMRKERRAEMEALQKEPRAELESRRVVLLGVGTRKISREPVNLLVRNHDTVARELRRSHDTCGQDFPACPSNALARSKTGRGVPRNRSKYLLFNLNWRSAAFSRTVMHCRP
jgi:hypothetical protein